MTSWQKLCAALTAACLASAGAAGLSACSSSSNGAGPGGNNKDGGTEGGGADLTPEQMFRAFQTDLVNTCGGTGGVCHVLGTFENAPTWLGNPDPYISAKSYPGIIPASGFVGDSLILTQIAHEGPSLQTYTTLFGEVRAWVQAELLVGQTLLPATAPFVVDTSGFNTIDLSKLAPGLDGAHVTFTAASNADVLSLSEMEVTGPTSTGMTMVAPFFAVIPASGPVYEDPTVTGFTGTQEVDEQASAQFFQGDMILLHWGTGAQLKLIFTAIGATTSTPPNTTGACNAVPIFSASAKPSFLQTFAYDGGTEFCADCHGGGDDVATNAMDLTQLGVDDSKACAQAKHWINFADKATSLLITNPEGTGNLAHPVQVVGADSGIVQGITTWVTAETP